RRAPGGPARPHRAVRVRDRVGPAHRPSLRRRGGREPRGGRGDPGAPHGLGPRRRGDPRRRRRPVPPGAEAAGRPGGLAPRRRRPRPPPLPAARRRDGGHPPAERLAASPAGADAAGDAGMSESVASLLAEVKAGKVRPLYLCWGEEFLVRRDAEALAQALVPDAEAGLNFAVLDTGSPREIAAELMTLPLFPGRKVVVARDPEFLAPKKGRVDALGKVREAWKAGRRKESARRLLALVARAGWGVAEVDPSIPGAPSPEAWREELGITLADADLDWLRE